MPISLPNTHPLGALNFIYFLPPVGPSAIAPQVGKEGFKFTRVPGANLYYDLGCSGNKEAMGWNPPGSGNF